jgi:hypothetical protein
MMRALMENVKALEGGFRTCDGQRKEVRGRVE